MLRPTRTSDGEADQDRFHTGYAPRHTEYLHPTTNIAAGSVALLYEVTGAIKIGRMTFGEDERGFRAAIGRTVRFFPAMERTQTQTVLPSSFLEKSPASQADQWTCGLVIRVC